MKKGLHDSEIEIQRAGDNVHTDQKNKRWGKKITHQEVLHFHTRVGGKEGPVCEHEKPNSHSSSNVVEVK